MLQSLHFPELNDDVRGLLQAQIPMIKFIGEQKVARAKNREAFINDWNPKQYHESYGEYLVKINATVQKCRKLNR